MPIEFRPLDAVAKNGRSHLVRDSQDNQHCASWCAAANRWRYGTDGPFLDPEVRIAQYAVNTCRTAGVHE